MTAHLEPTGGGQLKIFTCLLLGLCMSACSWRRMPCSTRDLPLLEELQVRWATASCLGNQLSGKLLAAAFSQGCPPGLRTAPPAAPFCRCPGSGPDLCTAVVPKYLLLALEVVVVILSLLRSGTIHLGRLPSPCCLPRAQGISQPACAADVSVKFSCSCQTFREG